MKTRILIVVGFALVVLIVGGILLLQPWSQAGVPSAKNPFEVQIQDAVDQINGVIDALNDHKHKDGDTDGSPDINPEKVELQSVSNVAEEAKIEGSEVDDTPYLDIYGPLLDAGFPKDRRIRMFNFVEMTRIDELVGINFEGPPLSGPFLCSPGSTVVSEARAEITVEDHIALDIYGERHSGCDDPGQPILTPQRQIRLFGETSIPENGLHVGGIIASNGLLVNGVVGVTGSVIVTGDLTVSGAKNFAHPHPNDSQKEIVYTSLEGGEAGTYHRGSAQLKNGKAIIELPEHFSLVTNEKGITVTVTPTAPCNGIYVVSKSNEKIVVRELLNGKSNATFDFLIQGVRKGYEREEVVREKRS